MPCPAVLWDSRSAVGDEDGVGMEPVTLILTALVAGAGWSVPAFLDTGLGCQLTELPIS